jgi:hypothetical protein
MNQRIEGVQAGFERIYIGGIPQLIRDETAFLSFVCMLAGTEALGGYRDPDASGTGANGKRFADFVAVYFPPPYRPHAKKLWEFRNGMIHGFSPRQFALTHHNSRAHMTRTPDGAIILNAGDFYAAFLSASNSYFAELASSPKLQANFVRRLESRRGGSLAVGFVEAVPEKPV